MKPCPKWGISMSEIITGKIVNIGESGYVDIRAPYSDWRTLCQRQYDEVLIELVDKRPCSNEQKAKAHILMKAVADYSGEDKEHTEFLLKSMFIDKYMSSLTKKYFSLATCDMTTARNFISMLVDFCIEYGVPLGQPLYELCEDIERYVYQCLMHKTCVICGRKAELHHCDGSTVGMGNNRKKIIHEGLEVMPLCRDHHMEYHQHGGKAFEEKYHIVGFLATVEICKRWGLKYECT